VRAGIAPAAVKLRKEAMPRVRLTDGRIPRPRATLDQLVADKAVLGKKVHASPGRAARSRAWRRDCGGEEFARRLKRHLSGHACPCLLSPGRRSRRQVSGPGVQEWTSPGPPGRLSIERGGNFERA
jgi:hypothetical protein